MSDVYNELLDATIQQLQELKAQGVRFVPVSAEGLAALSTNPRVLARPAPANKIPELGKPTIFPPSPPRGRGQGEGALAVQGDTLPEAPQLAKPVTSVSLPPIGGEGRGEGALRVQGESASSQETLTPQAKAAAFAELQQRASVCVKCPNLASSRKNVVFGVGSIDAQLMFVGEAPGADEDEQGEPFVGKAGQLLTKIIQTMGLQRGDVYIANILKCRPDTPGQSAGNRKPTPEEMNTCIPYLHEQIDLIRPKVLVALGATAVEGLLGKTVGITKLRGNWQTYRGIPLMPTFHPSYLLRNQSPGDKRQVWEDMLQVMEKLAMPISEKQKGFFLKPSA